MNIGILKILDFQARAKRRRDELWYNLAIFDQINLAKIERIKTNKKSRFTSKSG
jgi:hypothetical protein